ncbi:hypothetical protein [Priestia megaterium]|uniref:hypothetical protein n=1 Tax=Priestia megaterium TaxID=1404 RepID=UPI003CC669CC
MKVGERVTYVNVLGKSELEGKIVYMKDDTATVHFDTVNYTDPTTVYPEMKYETVKDVHINDLSPREIKLSKEDYLDIMRLAVNIGNEDLFNSYAGAVRVGFS